MKKIKLFSLAEKQQFLMALTLVLFGACKQSEFYQKTQDAAGISVPSQNDATATNANPVGNQINNNNGGGLATVPVAVEPVAPAVVIPTPAPVTPVAVIPDTPANPVGPTQPIVETPVIVAPVVPVTPVVVAPVAPAAPVIVAPVVPATPVVVAPVVPAAPVVVAPVVVAPVIVTPAPVVVKPIVVEPVITKNKEEDEDGDHEHDNDRKIASNNDDSRKEITKEKFSDHEERFKQKIGRDGDLDILLVIDNSGSMADNQENLAANLKAFITNFTKRGLDFRISITTTDATSKYDGRKIGDDSVLTSDYLKKNGVDKFISNFSRQVKVGTRGSGVEKGLRTATQFLSRYKSSFLRKDALFAAIIISDEDDQSGGNINNFVNAIQSVKEDGNKAKLYTIVTQNKSCMFCDESVGVRYNEASKLTGGFTSDINGDWAGNLNKISTHIADQLDSFTIGNLPYNNEIHVYVNGLELKSGFNFDANSKQIKFDHAHLPDEGAEIIIKYKIKES